MSSFFFFFFFLFNDTATTEIYTLSGTLSLHDALPISGGAPLARARVGASGCCGAAPRLQRSEEHTSELQSPLNISYAVFSLKKNKKTQSLTYCKLITIMLKVRARGS